MSGREAFQPQAICDANGRRWRVEGNGWSMQPEGALSADQAEAICRATALALAAPEGARAKPPEVGKLAHHAAGLELAGLVLKKLEKPGSALSCENAAAYFRSMIEAIYTARQAEERLDSIIAAGVGGVAQMLTPAQPAGAVPDSLRALSEAASALLNACMADMGPLDEMDRDDEPVGMSGFGVGTAVTFGHLRRLERALASHPAGQSAGSGAETRKRDGGQRIIEGLNDALAHAQGDTSRARILRIERAAPAPDSTRTGQGEETVAVPASALRWLFGDGPDADGVWFGDQIRGKGAFWWRSEFRKRIEAARPAASEAQGAWVRTNKSMLNLSGGGSHEWFRASDGTLQSFPHGFDPNVGRYDGAVISPAPPASSGQEG